MFPAPSRRDFLQLALGAAGLSLAPRALAQARPPSSPVSEVRHAALTTSQLGENLTVISGAGGNVVVVNAPDGVVMVNGGLAERSPELLKKVDEVSGGKRVHALFNTDWHRDHTGSNESLGKSGTEIIAHENTRQYLGNRIHVDWQDRTYKPMPSYALPKHGLYTTGKMTIGNERVEYGHLGQAHTDGDIYVFFPNSNVLVAGDALTVDAYPIPDYVSGGWIGGFVAAVKTMIDVTNADTRVVPGTGPVQTRADLQAEHDMLAAVRERLIKLVRQGMGVDEIVGAGATKEFDERWGDPEVFLRVTWRGMMLHVRELGGIV